MNFETIEKLIDYIITHNPDIDELINNTELDEELKEFILTFEKGHFKSIFEMVRSINDNVLLFKIYLKRNEWKITGDIYDENNSSLLMHALQKNKTYISIYLMSECNCDFNSPANLFGLDCGYYFIKNLAHMLDYESEFYGESFYPNCCFILTLPIYHYLKDNNFNLDVKYDDFMRDKSIKMSINEVYNNLTDFIEHTASLQN